MTVKGGITHVRVDASPIACCKRGCRERAVRPGAFCVDCGERYHRCEAHGGEAGARRSLHSHRGLHHPKVQR